MPTRRDTLDDNLLSMIEKYIDEFGIQGILKICETACLRKQTFFSSHDSTGAAHYGTGLAKDAWASAAALCALNLTSFKMR